MVKPTPERPLAPPLVALEGVSAGYGERTVLEDVSLKVPAGTFLGITGPTGSGKTVLGQLLTRSMDPTSGVVRVDGHDVRTIPLRVLQFSDSPSLASPSKTRLPSLGFNAPRSRLSASGAGTRARLNPSAARIITS